MTVSGEPTLEELYEDAPCGYLSISAAGLITRSNRTFQRSLGLSADELAGRPLRDLMAVGSRLYFETHWGPQLELQGEIREKPVDLLRADGTRLSVLLNAARGEDGAVRASLFDATDRRRYERELIAARDVERAARERVERLQRLSTALSEADGLDGVAAALADGVFDALAPEACAVVLDGRSLAERRQAHPEPGPAEAVTAPLSVGDRGDGALALTLAAARDLDEQERSFLESCAASGETALRRASLYGQMQHQALHDPVTGLPNRRGLDQRLGAELARGAEPAVVVLGLDGLKLLDDTRGHAAGDDALRHVAARLRGAVRDEDLVARFADDEFVVVAAGVDAEALGRRLAATLDAPVAIEGGDVFVRASVGLVVAATGDDPERVLADADIAMVAAKRSGTGDVVRFDAPMREGARERVRIEEGLRIALREGQLRVFYQPIAHAADGSLAGMEALVRWEHPERGLVAPATFIPVAEECGLIVNVGRFVLQQATMQLAEWREDGVVGQDVGVTVNVSARQLDHPDLVTDVAWALAVAGLDAEPWLLGLELTESMAMGSSERPQERLAELGALGVRILLDDFGTGASSLARLRRLPVDTLKIDRAFVTGLGDEEEDEAIVGAIIALADALDLEVVAEGVETDAQLARLRALGAGKVQGYLLSRPLPAEELAGLLTGWDAAWRPPGAALRAA